MSEVRQLHVSWNVPIEDGDVWTSGLLVAMRALEIRLQQDRLVPHEAPKMPTQGVEGYITGPYRVLRQFNPFPIVGITDELDDDGEPVYIYGEPCWMCRVDTLAKEMAV